MADATKTAEQRVVEIPTGYTPGPWWTDGKYDGREMGCSIVAASTEAGPLPGNPTRGMVAWASAIMNTDARRCEANARLIALAPDLAAAYQAQQAEIERLRGALKSIIPLAESGAAKPSHGGPCGPFEYCDGDCVTAHYDNRALEKARSALTEPHSHE